MTDVFPTLLAAAGTRPDAAWKIDGANLLGVWEGKAKSPERTLFWEWRSEGYNQLAAMRGDLKLVVTGNSPPELFDLSKDPAERRNVIAQHKALAARMRKELNAWLATETEESKWGRVAGEAVIDAAAVMSCRMIACRSSFGMEEHRMPSLVIDEHSGVAVRPDPDRGRSPATDARRHRPRSAGGRVSAHDAGHAPMRRCRRQPFMTEEIVAPYSLPRTGGNSVPIDEWTHLSHRTTSPTRRKVCSSSAPYALLTQGDFIDDCPLVGFEPDGEADRPRMISR